MTPEELKTWLKENIQKIYTEATEISARGYITAGATSLYQHLSEQVEGLKSARNAANDVLLTTNKNYQKAIDEIERLKGLAKEAYEAHYDGYGYALEKALKQMNNL